MTTGRKFPADIPRGYAAIEREAQRVRKIFGLTPTEALPGWELLGLLRKLPVVVSGRRIPVVYEVRELGSGVEAEARYQDGEIIVVLSDQTNDLLEGQHPRARFSLPHEFGHVTLHAPELVRLSEIPHPRAALLRGQFDDLPPYRDAEWQANTFAGAMLVPAAGMKLLAENLGTLSADLVREHFKVSHQCAQIRVEVYRKRSAELLRK